MDLDSASRLRRRPARRAGQRRADALARRRAACARRSCGCRRPTTATATTASWRSLVDDRPREGRLGLHRRRRQPLAGGAPARRRAGCSVSRSSRRRPDRCCTRVAEEGVPIRDIAEVIGRHLDLPVVSIAAEDAAEHFSWLAGFLGLDSPASSTLTRELLGWEPTQPGADRGPRRGPLLPQVVRVTARDVRRAPGPLIRGPGAVRLRSSACRSHSRRSESGRSCLPSWARRASAGLRRRASAADRRRSRPGA